MSRESSFRKVEKFGLVLVRFPPLLLARSERLPPAQTTQKPASAPPRTCRTAPNVLLHVEDLPRTSLSAGRRRATLIRQAAPSPRAKAAIGWRGPWRLYGILYLGMGRSHAWEPLD